MDRKLIELLTCPVTQGSLELDQEHQVLISRAAQLVYPIRDGIPILLEQEAMALPEWEQQTSAPSGVEVFNAQLQAQNTTQDTTLATEEKLTQPPLNPEQATPSSVKEEPTTD